MVKSIVNKSCINKISSLLMVLILGVAFYFTAVSSVPATESPEQWYRDGQLAVEQSKHLLPNRKPAKNVILFVGDGMGVSTVTAARILEGQLRGKNGEENLLSFEILPYLALSKTYNTNQQTPDSAGTMTAMMTGVKTKAGLISVNQHAIRGSYSTVAGNELKTLLEIAEEKGMSTGVVTTARLTHATPAASYAHVPERNWEDYSKLPADAKAAGFPDIARQLIEFPYGDGIEVALGGGRRHFLPSTESDPEDAGKTGQRSDGRNLVNEWLSKYSNSAYVWNKTQFDATDPAATDHLLGLFERSHMEYEYDRPSDTGGEPSLSEMTAKAIEILSKSKKGYFLMVEGGRIDHAHHASNAYRALTDTIEFANTVKEAMEKTDPKDTLIIVTADHSHVFTIAGYPTRGNDILGKVISNDSSGEPSTDYSRDMLGLPYTTLGYANGPGYTGASDKQLEGPKTFEHFPGIYYGITSGRPDLALFNTSDPNYLQESTVPLNSETHAGEDVSIYAGGPGAYLFHGVMEQNVVFHIMKEALRLK